MSLGISQFRVLPQHVAYMERQRVNPSETPPVSSPRTTAADPAAREPSQPTVLSGADLASTALLLVQCQIVQDIERDTHLLEPGLYEQTYDGPWARVGD